MQRFTKGEIRTDKWAIYYLLLPYSHPTAAECFCEGMFVLMMMKLSVCSLKQNEMCFSEKNNDVVLCQQTKGF